MMADAMARFGIFGGVLMLLFWVSVVAGIMLLLRWLLTRPSADGTPRETVREMIERRYASGEIDRESYLKMLDDIKDTAD